MTDSDRLRQYRIALSKLHGMTAKLAGEFIARVGSEERFFSLTESQLGATMGFRSKLFGDSIRRQSLEEAARELDFARSNGIGLRYFNDPESGYPPSLLECEDAPVLLYTLGEFDPGTTRAIAIVGTRHATNYGCNVVTRIAGEIAATVDESVTIVSGLAYGVDAAAHKAALDNGLSTVAVLAHGLNTIYPAANRSLAADIVGKGGCLVTEYGILDAVHRGNFLARNRIVAGLCEATVVIESDVKGGAMTTARLASDYGRDVYALPGRVNDKYSAGCNFLIHNNTAAIITNPADFVKSLGWRMRTVEGLQQELFKELDPLEQKIIDILTENGDARLSELQMRLGLPTHRLSATLIDMEFRGLIQAVPGARYTLG